LNQKENELNLLFWSSILALPYWLFVIKKTGKEIKTISKKAVIVLILTGLISSLGIKILEIFAVKNTQAINFSFLVRTVIVFTILFDFIIMKNAITKKKIVLSILILLGVYLLVAKGQLIVLSTGDILTLCEAMLIALGNNVLGKMATNLMSVDLSSAGNYFVGLIPLIGVCIVFGRIGMPINFALVLLSTIILVVMTTMRYKAIKETSATYLTLVISLTPIWVTIMAVLFLNESITLIQVIGGTLIVSSVYIVEKLKI
jgi:drug/metabolite transporter (DMT)-like permease